MCAGYAQFCGSEAWANADRARPYCQPAGPSLYSFIQSNYWGVGLFKYYQLQQVRAYIDPLHVAFRTLLHSA